VNCLCSLPCHDGFVLVFVSSFFSFFLMSQSILIGVGERGLKTPLFHNDHMIKYSTS
jgi:hypothetical protein